MKKLIALLAMTALCACETNTVLDERAVEHNIALENTKNKIALLNVIRSSERLPMTFSRLGSLKYTTARGPGTTWAAPLGGLVDDAASLTFAPAINDSNVADFDALNGEEFYKSILASVEPSVVKYYRDRGFPDEIVFSLFIEEISFKADATDGGLNLSILGEVLSRNLAELEESDAIKRVGVYETNGKFKHDKLVLTNDPDDAAEFLAFRQMVRHVTSDYEIELRKGLPKTPPTKYIYSLSHFKNALPEHLPKGATVDRDGNVFIPSNDAAFIQFSKKKSNKKGRQLLTSTNDIEITFRSPASILYYLGEMQRAQTDRKIVSDYKAHCSNSIYGWQGIKDYGADNIFEFENDFRIGLNNPCSSEQYEPFFIVHSEPFDRARVSQTRHDLDYYGFEYQGRYYWVSRDQNKRGRTMQNITLVNELFDQKQKASEAPRVTVLQGRTF